MAKTLWYTLAMDIPKFPKPTGQDLLYGTVKGVISGFPLTGPASAEIMAIVFAPPIERRREAWFSLLAVTVSELHSRVAELTPERLSRDEAFVTVAFQAAQIAIRTHHKEKWEALRNAVRNTALPEAPEETMQQIFLNLIDVLTPLHLKALAFVAKPPAPLESRERQLTETAPHFLEGMSGLGGKPSLCEQVFNDLLVRGLVYGGSQSQIAVNGLVIEYAPHITEIGAEFLRFISEG